MSWHRWIRSLDTKVRPIRTRTTRRPKRQAVVPCLEGLEDRTLFAVSLLSAAATASSTTASGQSEIAPIHSISDDGRFVVFASTANNLVSSQSASATGKTLNIYLYDNQSGTTTLISHDSSSSSKTANKDSFNAVISGDGSTVVFYSAATDLLGSSYTIPSGDVELYAYNVSAGTLTLVSFKSGDTKTGANGTNPAIPPTGSQSGTFVNTLGYSVGSASALLGQDIMGLALPGVSTDGKYIAYISDAYNLAASNTGGSAGAGSSAHYTNVYLYDSTAGTNTLVSHSTSSSTTSAGGFASTVAISGDGTTIAFTDPATDLISNFGNSNNVDDQLYVYSRTDDTATGLSKGQIALASHKAGDNSTPATIPTSLQGGLLAQLYGFTGWTADNPPSLSSDGSAIAYYFAGNNVVSNQAGTASVLNVFRYDVKNNKNALVTHVAPAANATQAQIDTALATAGDNPQNKVAPPDLGPVEATGPQISSDGRYIAFANNSSNLLSTTITNNGRDNVYLYDNNNPNTLTLVSHADGSATTPDANGGTAPSMSSNGRYVAFVDWAYPTTSNPSAANANVRLFDSQASSTTQPTSEGEALNTTYSNTAAKESAILAPTVLSANGNALVWDGSSANGFTAASGKTLDVFFISLSKQLDITLSTSTVTGGQPVGTTVGTLTTTGGNPNDTFTYSLVTGTGSTDNSKFTITGNTLKTNTTFSVTTPTTYSIRVETNGPNSQTFDKVLTITVNPPANQPTDITVSNGGTTTGAQPVGSTVTTFTTTTFGTSTDTFTYSLVSGPGSTDNAKFTITGNTLQFNTVISVATPTTFSVRVRTTGPTGLTYDKVITITVNPAYPTDIALSNNTISAAQPVGTTVGTLSTTDPNPNQSFTYSLTGTDAAKFTVTSNGVLQSNVVFAVGSPTSYTFTVHVVDTLGLSLDKSFTVTVNPAYPTDITLSNSTIAAAQPAGTTVGTLSTTDPNANQAFTYSLTGPNASLFTVDSNGTLKTNTVFAVGTTTTYSLGIHVVDTLGLTFDKTFTLTVNPAQPTDITLSNSTIVAAQDVGTTVGTFSTTDPNVNQSFTYSLTSGSITLFTITGNVLKTNTLFKVGVPTTYSLGVHVVDTLGLSFDKTFTITVNPANPTDITLSNSSVLGGQPAGTAIGNLNTVDPNAGQSFSYTLTGSNSSLFAVVNGVLTTNSVLVGGTTYSLGVHSTDTLGLSVDKTFTITVNPAPPTDIALSNNTVLQQQPSGTAVGSFSTLDPNLGPTFTYSLVAGTGGDGNSFFTISGNVLQTATTFTASSLSSYSILVSSTDSYGLSVTKAFTINVQPFNNPPTDIALSGSTVDPNAAVGTFVGSFTTTDADVGDSFTYTLVSGEGSDDNASFSITGSSLTTATALSQSQATYHIRVRTTDAGGLTFEKEFTVTALSLDIGPTAIALSNSTVSTDQPVGTLVGTLSTTDSDSTETFTYSLVNGTGSADNSLFTISGNQVTTTKMFQVGDKSSYTIRVRSTATDGLSTEEVFTITLVNPTSTGQGSGRSAPATAASSTTTTSPNTNSTIQGLGTTSTVPIKETDAQVANAVLGATAGTTPATTQTAPANAATNATAVQNGAGAQTAATGASGAGTSLSFADKQPAGTTVTTLNSGTLGSGTYTYALVDGPGGTDNSRFTISGNTLKTATMLDSSTQSSYSIRVRVTDQNGQSTDQVITIQVTPKKDTPEEEEEMQTSSASFPMDQTTADATEEKAAEKADEDATED
jgi:hypothetical protein